MRSIPVPLLKIHFMKTFARSFVAGLSPGHAEMGAGWTKV
jgi:hypothetical protein